MNRILVYALAVCTVLPMAAARADDDSGDDNASALVTLAPVHRGSLPVTVTAFGKTVASPTARENLTAPIAALVAKVTVQMGQQIAKGTAMITLVPSPETRAAYEQAQLAARLAAQLVERDQSMVKAHLLTQSELDKAENDLANAQSTLAVLTEEGATGPNTLKAPFDAIVLKSDAAAGSAVSRGDALIELARPNGLVVEVGVDPAQALAVKPGNTVALAPLNAGAHPVSGQVMLRSAVVDPATGLVPVQIGFPTGTLLVGEMVRATVTVGEQAGYVVPHEAILVDDDGATFVMQAVKMAAKKVAVKVLGSAGDQDVIEGKLDASASLVLAGNHQLDDGTKLRVSDAASPGKDAK